MILSNQQLHDILGIIPDEPLVDDADSRRAAPRIACGRRAWVIRFDKTGRRDEARVMLHDISVKGVGFLGDAGLRVGERFVLHVNDSSEKPLYLKCTTRRCESGGIGGVSFVVGATFDDWVDGSFTSTDLTGGSAMAAAGSSLTWAKSILSQLNPVRLIRHPFRRYDDYSSIEDTKWFRRGS